MPEDLTSESNFPNAKNADDLKNALNNDIKTLGASITFKNVHKEGENVVGDVTIFWDETVLGKHIVIIDQTVHFSIAGRQEILSFEIPLPFGLKIKVHADAYYEPPNRVCAEARAEWPGGNAGLPPVCTDF